MKRKKTFLYTLKDKDKVPIIQCFNYKEAKAIYKSLDPNDDDVKEGLKRCNEEIMKIKIKIG